MRIATYNLENLDDAPVPANKKHKDPTFDERVEVLRPSLKRLDADIVCFQEVHGQNIPNQPRSLRALRTLLMGTQYQNYDIASTTLKDKPDVEAKRNLVTIIPQGWIFDEVTEIKHDFASAPKYKTVTSSPEATQAKPVTWERPLLYTKISSPDGSVFHVLNAHFKSKNPSRIEGQGPANYQWKTTAGWAEGYFLSSMKRVGAALEARIFIDQLFETDRDANIVICGDLNAGSDEVPLAALMGKVEDTGNSELNHAVMVPVETSVPDSARFTLYHHGKKNLLDHLLVSRTMVAALKKTEIHNEMLQDESVAYAFDKKYPGSDHAPVVAEFDFSMGAAIGV